VAKSFPFVNYLPYNYEHKWVYLCQVYDYILQWPMITGRQAFLPSSRYNHSKFTNISGEKSKQKARPVRDTKMMATKTFKPGNRWELPHTGWSAICWKQGHRSTHPGKWKPPMVLSNLNQKGFSALQFKLFPVLVLPLESSTVLFQHTSGFFSHNAGTTWKWQKKDPSFEPER